MAAGPHCACASACHRCCRLIGLRTDHQRFLCRPALKARNSDHHREGLSSLCSRTVSQMGETFDYRVPFVGATRSTIRSGVFSAYSA